MTTATINGTPCISVDVRLSRQGVWRADARVDQAVAVEGRCTLSLSDGALELKGTVKRTGTYGETAVLRIRGGAGGFAKEVPPKFYRHTTARIVVQDILTASGETLSQSADAGLLGRQLVAHCQRRAVAGDALSLLVGNLGAIWRVLPDGTVWIGTESWPDAAEPGDLLSEDPSAQRSTYGTEAPQVLPGTLVNGRHISIVEHHVSADSVSTVLAWETDPQDFDRHTRAQRAIFDHFAARFEYLGKFHAKVASQNSDKTLELQLDDETMPGLTKVPIRYGVPGVTAKVPKGTRCDVEFEGGDPGAPVATGFEPGSLLELKIDGSDDIVVNGGSLKVARDTDPTASGTFSMLAAGPVAGVTTVTFLWTPESGAPVTIGTIGLTVAGGTAAALQAAHITGKITDGAGNFHA